MDLAGVLAQGGGDGAAGPYETVAAGALPVEVPTRWQHASGEAPEIGGYWWDFGGEGTEPSITSASDLEVWYSDGIVQGVDVVASRDMARYTDEQLVASGGNGLGACEPGVRSDYERGPYFGRVQAWTDCFGDPAISAVSLSAAPEGRECVVVLHALMIGEEDVEAGQRVLDTF